MTTLHDASPFPRAGRAPGGLPWLRAAGLSLLLAMTVAAQAPAGGTKPVGGVSSGAGVGGLGRGVFTPPPTPHEGPPGHGGGQWIPGPDIGAPGGDTPDDGAGDDEDAPTPARPDARPLSRATPGRTTATGVRGGSDRPEGASAPFVPDADDWLVWWEANKFDFIELRRIEDAPYTGQGLEHETPAQREQRLARVRANLREKILPTVRRLAGAPDANVRAAAAVALGKLRDGQSVEQLSTMLADPSLATRRSAMMALGILESGRGSYLLMNIADDTPSGRALLGDQSLSVDDRGTALMVAALRGDRTAELLVAGVLDDRAQAHPELLAMGCEAAGLMGSSRLLGPLVEIAFDDGLPEYVRSSAASALGRIGDPAATRALIELLGGDLQPRRAAASALGYVTHAGEERVIDQLGRTLRQDGDAPTRHFAAISLGRIGGDAARAHLLAAFRDARPDMRPWLALALGLSVRSEHADHSAAVDQVAELLMQRLADESNASTMGAEYIALGLTRAEQGLAALGKGARSRRVEVASQAALALGLTGRSRAEAMLRDVLVEADSPLIVRQAALGLGVLGDTSSIPALVDLIRTTNNPFVASHAAIGVALMGDEDAAGPLLAVLDREGTRGVTAAFAVHAMGQLFDSDRRPALSRLAAGDNYLARVSAVDDLLSLGF